MGRIKLINKKENIMRLWSISPSYLDRSGLCGLWRESLLAQSVLLKEEYAECSKCNGWGRIFTGKFIGIKNETYFCEKCKRTGKIKTPYWGHPQLQRFKKCERPLDAIGRYLLEIYAEAEVRGYKFDSSKIKGKLSPMKLTVTKAQLEYEFNHLQNKLWNRDRNQWHKNARETEKFSIDITVLTIEQHPLFKVIDGTIESWEKIKEKNQ
jgi:hypothetical protein